MQTDAHASDIFVPRFTVAGVLYKRAVQQHNCVGLAQWLW